MRLLLTHLTLNVGSRSNLALTVTNQTQSYTKRSNSPKLVPSIKSVIAIGSTSIGEKPYEKFIYRRVSRFEKGDAICLTATRKD